MIEGALRSFAGRLIERAWEKFYKTPIYIPAADEREYYTAAFALANDLKVFGKGLAKLEHYQSRLTRLPLRGLAAMCLGAQEILDEQVAQLGEADHKLWESIVVAPALAREEPTAVTVPEAETPPEAPWPGDVYCQDFGTGRGAKWKFDCLHAGDVWAMKRLGVRDAGDLEEDFFGPERRARTHMVLVERAARPANPIIRTSGEPVKLPS